MPSSSHGSSGSHFGGGRSFGGSSSHGGRSSGSTIRTGPIFVHFGGSRYRMSSGKSTLMGVLIFLNIMLLLLGIGMVCSTNKDKLAIIEDDYLYYHSMINYSKLHPEYTTTAVITSVSKKYGKYWFNYRFDTSFSDSATGFTYCLYDESDLESIREGRTIVIAIDQKKDYISFNVDSAPMDMVNYSAQDDGEYIYLKNQAKRNHTVGILTLSLSGVFLIANVVLCCKFFKKVEQTDDTNTETSAIGSKQPKSNYCAYCGKLIPNGQDSCSACGAKVTRFDDKLDDENKK